MPTAKQILGAQIRAAGEDFINKRKKPKSGGFSVPFNKDKYKHLAEMFGMSPVDVSYFFTFSRYCDHEWSEGACDKCPE